jgi:hypothetical protein
VAIRQGLEIFSTLELALGLCAGEIHGLFDREAVYDRAMNASRSAAFAASAFLALGLLRCGGSDHDGSASGGSGGSGKAGSGNAGGSHAGSASGGGSAGGSHAGTAGEGGAAGEGAGTNGGEGGVAGAAGESGSVTTPVIGEIADLAVVQNTVATPTLHVSFSVSDAGGFAGMKANATSKDLTHVVPAASSCSAGTCAFDVKVSPTVAESVAVEIVVTNARGGTAMGQFAVTIAPRLVTTGTDAGAGSLRATVAEAKQGDVIAFATAVKKVQLATQQLDLTGPLTLSGPGASALTIDGGTADQVISTSGNGLAISGLTVTGGKTVGLGVYGGHATLSGVSVTASNGHGLGITGSAGMSTTVDASNCSFTGNATNGALVLTSGAGSSAVANFKGCTFSGNVNGLAVVTNGAGEVATLDLVSGNKVLNNTQRGIVFDNTAGGTPSLAMPPAGGTGDNSVTGNPVGILRNAGVPSAALKISPASQVTGNTTNFSPAWP